MCVGTLKKEVLSLFWPNTPSTNGKPYKDVDLLFIDDLGLRSKQETDFAYITLYSLLNKRQERLLPTFISTNKDLDRLRASFDERIVSRLQTALQIELKGEDRRKAKKI